MRAVFVALTVKFQSKIRTTNGAFSHFLRQNETLIYQTLAKTSLKNRQNILSFK